MFRISTLIGIKLIHFFIIRYIRINMSVPDFVKILEVKRYSRNTIDSYSSIVRNANHFFKKPMNMVDESELHRYFYHMVNTRKASYSYQKQIAMALKLYYKEVYGVNINLEFFIP